MVAFRELAKVIHNEKGVSITSIRSDHGREFQNEDFEFFCNEKGIMHNVSTPRNPQQNGVVERKNRSLVELARSMLNETNLPKYIWADVVDTSYYVMNYVLIQSILNRTPHELYKRRNPNISYFHVLGCKCFIHNYEKDNHVKFDTRADEGIFIGYSISSKAFRVYNIKTKLTK